MSSCVNTDTSRPAATGNLEEARTFLNDAEKQLLDLNIKSARADWIKSTFVTDDTEAVSAQANSDLIASTTELAEKARRFETLDLSPDEKRKLKLLKLSLTLPAPKDPKEREELTKIAASMEGDYGKGKFCPDGDQSKVSKPW